MSRNREAAEAYADELAEDFAAAEEAALSMYAALGGEAGQRALDALRKMTTLTPSWVPGQDVAWGYFREGQNDIVRRIERLIEVGRQLGISKRGENG